MLLLVAAALGWGSQILAIRESAYDLPLSIGLLVVLYLGAAWTMQSIVPTETGHTFSQKRFSNWRMLLWSVVLLSCGAAFAAGGMFVIARNNVQ
jgi:drug/metabolite transporter (DMT)-like permease